MTVEIESFNTKTKKDKSMVHTVTMKGQAENGVEVSITLKSSEQAELEDIVALGQPLTYELKLNAVEPGDI
jgi:hypothetical protein